MFTFFQTYHILISYKRKGKNMNRNFENYDNSLYEMDMDCLKEQQREYNQDTNLHLQNANRCHNEMEDDLKRFVKQCQPNSCGQEKENNFRCRDEERENNGFECRQREVEQRQCKPICKPKERCCDNQKNNNNSCLILLLLLCCCGNK